MQRPGSSQNHFFDSKKVIIYEVLDAATLRVALDLLAKRNHSEPELIRLSRSSITGLDGKTISHVRCRPRGAISLGILCYRRG
jgi:hypothetical protein